MSCPLCSGEITIEEAERQMVSHLEYHQGEEEWDAYIEEAYGKEDDEAPSPTKG